MQEKDDNSHIDERKKTNLGLCNNDSLNKEEKRKLRIAFYVIVAIYILAIFCNIEIANNLKNKQDDSSISSNHNNKKIMVLLMTLNYPEIMIIATLKTFLNS